MTVRIDDARGLEEPLREALGEVPWLPYRRGFGLDDGRAVEAAMAAMGDPVSDNTDRGWSLVARSGHHVLGGLALKPQAFETEIFGIPVARSGFAFVTPSAGDEGPEVTDALLRAGLDACRDAGFAHWSLLVPADDAELTQGAVRRGWLLADSTLDFTWDLEREGTLRGRCAEEVSVRMSRPEDTEVLSRMARTTYTTSIRTRYLADPHLPAEDTGRLYAQWAERACQGSFADVVAVAEVEGRIAGFDMLKLDADLSGLLGVGVGRKGIAAVEPWARGRGITSCMEAFLNRWHRENGGRFNSGRVLFNNIPMQHALRKVGGVVTAAFHTFHAWPRADRSDGGAGGEDRA